MITTMGELLIDYTFAGTSQSGMQLFEQNAGGAVANAVAAVAKLGYPAAFISKVGKDFQGKFLVDSFNSFSVDTSGIKYDDYHFTTLAFVSLSKEGERSFAFARKPGADTQITPEEIDVSILQKSKIFGVGSLSLCVEPARNATHFAIATAKKGGSIIAYDPNYRASLWENETLAVQQMRSLINSVDIMKLSDEETALLTDEIQPEKAAQKLLDMGVKVVCVTLGKKGALVATKEGKTLVPGFKQPAVDTTGAGDAFWGGFLRCLAVSQLLPTEVTLEKAVEFATFANAVATLCVGKRGGAIAMPTLAEVEEFLKLNF